MNYETQQEMDNEDECFSAIEMRDTQLVELKEKVSRRDQQFKSMATAMLQNGMSIEAIAQTIGKTTDEVKALQEA